MNRSRWLKTPIYSLECLGNPGCHYGVQRHLLAESASSPLTDHSDVQLVFWLEPRIIDTNLLGRKDKIAPVEGDYHRRHLIETRAG